MTAVRDYNKVAGLDPSTPATVREDTPRGVIQINFLCIHVPSEVGVRGHFSRASPSRPSQFLLQEHRHGVCHREVLGRLLARNRGLRSVGDQIAKGPKAIYGVKLTVCNVALLLKAS